MSPFVAIAVYVTVVDVINLKIWSRRSSVNRWGRACTCPDLAKNTSVGIAQRTLQVPLVVSVSEKCMTQVCAVSHRLVMKEVVGQFATTPVVKTPIRATEEEVRQIPIDLSDSEGSSMQKRGRAACKVFGNHKAALQSQNDIPEGIREQE